MYYCRYQTCKKVQQCQYQTYKTWSPVNNIIWSRLQGLQTLYPRVSFHVSGWNFPVHKYYVSLSEKHIVSSCTMTTFPCKQMNIHQDNFTPTGSLTRKKTVTWSRKIHTDVWRWLVRCPSPLVEIERGVDFRNSLWFSETSSPRFNTLTHHQVSFVFKKNVTRRSCLFNTKR